MTSRIRFTLAGLFAVLCASQLSAQGAGQPLTLQGMNQWLATDVRDRAMGGVAVVAGRSSNAVFSNPALLGRLSESELRVSGLSMTTERRQKQEWVPDRLYAGLSILMEDKWAGIKEPLVFDPTDSTYKPPTSPFEQLQKPYDTMGPNWFQSSSHGLPLTFSAAMPIEFLENSFVIGVGAANVIDLDHYFQNNNVLDPMIGSYRPSPIPVVRQGDTLHVRWYRHIRDRQGTLQTVSPAIAMNFGRLSAGLAVNVLFGSSDDYEQRWDRGELVFIYNAFKVDSIHYVETRTGTSTYRGTNGTAGFLWESDRYAIGATVTLPTSIERSFTRTFTRDTALSSSTVNESGTEELRLPLRYSVGLLLKPTERWSISVDYGMTGFAESEQVGADGSIASTWVGGNELRLGGEFLPVPWLAVRGGYRQEVQPFAVVGSAILNEPVKTSVITFGLGITFGSLIVEGAYEYRYLKYQDLWQSNINTNLTEQHLVALEFGYRF